MSKCSNLTWTIVSSDLDYDHLSDASTTDEEVSDQPLPKYFTPSDFSLKHLMHRQYLDEIIYHREQHQTVLS